MWLIMTPVTCVTIQLETATSPLLIPTTTHNLKSPLPLCRAHGKHPLRVKPGKWTPPLLPQPQPLLRHPPTQHDPTVSTGHHAGILLAPPLVEGCGHSFSLPCHLQRHRSQQRQRDGHIDSEVLTGMRCIDNRMGVSTAGHVYQQGPCISTAGGCIDGGAGVLMMGKAYWQWGRHIDGGEGILMVGNAYWWWGMHIDGGAGNSTWHRRMRGGISPTRRLAGPIPPVRCTSILK